MKILLRIVLFAALAAAGWWLWTVLFPPPEKVVRRQLATLARTVSFQADENALAIASKASTLLGMFTTNVEVTVEVSGHGERHFDGRDELMQAVAGARSATRSLAVEFIDVNVTVAPDKRSATASLTVRARAGDEKEDFLQPVRFTLERSGRDWLIRRVETLRTLT